MNTDKANPTTGLAGEARSNPAADLTGQTLGDFRVLRRLGQGGMGQVYLAEQVSLKRRVALKVLRADLAANPTALQRFKSEIEAVAQATHANIVQLHAVGECQGLPFMVLEYVEGRNLREYLARKGPPEPLLALSIMRQVAAALQRAGELGIIHRDIKPENILLTRKGEVKVADFGLSRCLAGDGQPLNLTQSGITMGTPLYMSPEQVQGGQIDARTDIYSLGVTCYHMLAGQPPFQGDNPFQVALHHVNTEPVPLNSIRPDLPAELCAVVHKMMAKDPAQRYQTGQELLRDLVRLREKLVRDGGPQQTGPVSLDSGPLLTPVSSLPGSGSLSAPSGLMTPPPRRRRVLLFVLSLLAALLGGSGLAYWLRQAPLPLPTNDVVAGESGPVVTANTLQKREQFLKEAVEQYANPGKDPTQVRLGVGHFLELGVFYLEQWRLEDADRVFTRLENAGQDLKPYRLLGRIGHAIVLGLQNDTTASNDLFQKIFDPRAANGDRAEGVMAFLQQNPKLAEWVGLALDYNHINGSAEHPFPSRLEPFRHPSTLIGPGRGGTGDKPASKSVKASREMP